MTPGEDSAHRRPITRRGPSGPWHPLVLLVIGALVLVGCTAETPEDPDPSPTEGAAQDTTAVDTAPALDGPGELTPGEPRPPSPPTSRDLIEQALADGAIDEPTALLYRTWAQFNDPQLPQEYRGAPGVHDLQVIVELRERLDSLPDEVRSQVQPYLLRPTDPQSAFTVGASTDAETSAPATGTAGGSSYGEVVLTALDQPHSLATAPEEDRTCTAGWTSASDDALPFRVWNCESRYMEEGWEAELDVLTALDNYVMPMMQDVPAGMGPPVPDRSSDTDHPDADDKIDIYVIDPRWFAPARDSEAETLTDAGGASLGMAIPADPFRDYGSSGYILLNSDLLSDRDLLNRTVVHEVFHVLQFAHSYAVLWEDAWFVEGTATWAEAHFVPRDSAAVHAAWAWMLQRSEQPLTSDVPDGHEYASYLWPMFMAQEAGPGSIFQVWEALGGFRPAQLHDALVTEIKRHVHLSDEFHEFAMRLLNADLTGDPIRPRFVDHDPNFPDGQQPLFTTHELGESELQVDLTDLPGLGYDFHHVTVPGPQDSMVAVRVTADDALRGRGVAVVEALVRDDHGMYARKQIDLADGTEFCVAQKLGLVASNGATDTGETLLGSLRLERTENPACELAGDVMLELTGEYHSSADVMPYTDHSTVHWAGALEVGLGERTTDEFDGTQYYQNTGSVWSLHGSYRHERCDAFAPDRCAGYIVEQTFEASGVEITESDATTSFSEADGWSVDGDGGWLRAVVDGDELRLEASLPVTITTTRRHPLLPTETTTDEATWGLECGSGGTWWTAHGDHDEYTGVGGEALTARWTDSGRTAEIDCQQQWDVEVDGAPDESGSATFSAEGTISID